MKIEEFPAFYRAIERRMANKDREHFWHTVWDRPILAVCQENPEHTDVNQVRTKVGCVNRMYKAILGGIRDLLSPELDKTEFRVAEEFVAQNADAIMADLRKLPGFTADTLREIVASHEKLVGIVRAATGRREDVFCSKYASFHFPEIVPILDRRAEEMAQKWTDIPGVEGKGRYEQHCLRLLYLIRVLQSDKITSPSLKVLDHILYNKLEP
jgi:hypothetical protein